MQQVYPTSIGMSDVIAQQKQTLLYDEERLWIGNKKAIKRRGDLVLSLAHSQLLLLESNQRQGRWWI
jgi:hypothetical protein